MAANPGGLGTKGSTGIGELDPATGAVKQPGLEQPLEPLDLLRQRWLGNAQPGGRSAEVELVGDGEEVPEMPEFDLINHIDAVSI